MEENNFITCGNCGEKVESNFSFCPNCGAKTTEKKIQNPQIMSTNNTGSKKKKFSLTLVIVLVVGVIAVILITGIFSKPRNKKNADYDTALQVCCDAVNKRNKKLLKNFVYEKLGSDWNNEYIFDVIDEYYNDQIKYKEDYGRLTTDIDDYEHYTSRYDLKEWESEIFDETSQIVHLEELYDIEMDNESCMEIILMKIEGKWYILYMDL